MTQTAKKEISINAFYANTPGQNWIGLWSLPGSRASEYTNLDYWVDVARIAERGLFDFIFSPIRTASTMSTRAVRARRSNAPRCSR